jgi:hypothetical protein
MDRNGKLEKQQRNPKKKTMTMKKKRKKTGDERFC